MVSNEQIATAASKVGIGAASVTAGGSFFDVLNEYATVIGLFIAFTGLVINWYYRHQQHKREQAR